MDFNLNLFVSMSSLNLPHLVSVSGIGFSEIQPPAVCWKKSSQGATDVSRWSTLNAATLGASSGAVQAAMARGSANISFFICPIYRCRESYPFRFQVSKVKEYSWFSSAGWYTLDTHSKGDLSQSGKYACPS